MIFVSVVRTMIDHVHEDSNISLDLINVDVGKRIRMECELTTNSSTNLNRKVEWKISDENNQSFFFFNRVYGYV